MKKSDRLQNPQSSVTFKCPICRASFSAEPDRIEDAPAQTWHPWAYFADCPDCEVESPQAPWEKTLFRAWREGNSGPKTPEGIAACTANLEGHPTPEEALRTRFNGLKHGLNARTATYFPARPGKYPQCAKCDVDWHWCSEQPACTKQTQLFMLTHAAFETRNPKHLNGVYADLQAAIFATVQQILQKIIQDGTTIEAPQWYTDKETGQLVIAEYFDEHGQRHVIKDIAAHPLFKPLGELLSRNNLSLADMGMTQKVIDDEEQELGRLQSQEQSREALSEYSQRQAKALEDLRVLMDRANVRRDADPVLIEYQQQNGDRT